ncbi:glycosyltransferase [Streptomyces sp. NPDC005538]|uniref:glycosyltransferase family 4 protein n=1 Tax=unclassified Streptomyces TaxID=2593676 RepID=UPI0033A4D33C
MHSVFSDTVTALRDVPGLRLGVNRWWRDGILHVHTVGPLSLTKMVHHKGIVVVSAHLTADSFSGSIIGAERYYRLSAGYLRAFYNRADLVLAVSSDVESKLVNDGVTRPVVVVPNRVPRNLFMAGPGHKSEARSQLGLGLDEKIVLCVAQLQPRKRPDVFIECARRCPDITFVWVGDSLFGPFSAERKSLRQEMFRAPGNVRFIGAVHRQVVAQWCRAADLFLFPSEQETFGLAALEAAAAGLPLILRDLSVYGDLFGRRGTGWIPARSASEFAQGVRLILSSATLRRSLAQSSVEASEKFDLQTLAASLINAYADFRDTTMRSV